MIAGLLPYYNREKSYFRKSLENQTYKDFVIVPHDTSTRGILWTKAMNELYTYCLVAGKDNDVVCFLNNDLELAPDFFEKGKEVKEGEILIPKLIEGDKIEWGLEIDWSKKRIFASDKIDVCCPRGKFMTMRDFKKSGGFCTALPHYLSDYEFFIRQFKKGLKPVRIDTEVYHRYHARPEASIFSKLNPANPFYWSVFLWKCGMNKYFIKNLFKVWITPLLKGK